MINRADRRKARKATPRFERLSVETQRRAMGRNGITPENLKAEYARGYKEGYNDGVGSTYTALYAGVCLAASEELGFGETRCLRLIRAADEIVLNRLTTKDLCDAVFERMGLQILNDEPFDRVEEVRARKK